MINAEKKARSIGILMILTIILIGIAVSLWLLYSSTDSQQDKTYSGAKLVELRQEYKVDWRVI